MTDEAACLPFTTPTTHITITTQRTNITQMSTPLYKDGHWVKSIHLYKIQYLHTNLMSERSRYRPAQEATGNKWL